MKYLNIEKIYQSLCEIKELLKELLKKQTFEPLDLNQAAEYLKLKPSYIYSLIHQKKIPHYKPNGKRVLFNKLELNEWIAKSRIKSIDEVEEEYNKQKQNGD